MDSRHCESCKGHDARTLSTEYEYPETNPYTIASWWHDGQWSELYKLSSSGKVDSASLLICEIEKCQKLAKTDKEQNELEILLIFAQDEFANQLEKESKEES